MSTKYDILNNESLLRQMYENGESTTSIAKKIGCKSCNSVRQALKRFNINIRTSSESLNFHKLDININYDILHGSLLGDAWYSKYNHDSLKSFPKFCKKNKFLSHIEYIASSFYTNSYKEYIKDDINNINGKRLIYYKFCTAASSIFLDDYYKWYPNKQKIVPRGIINITPTLLMNWFLDDGSSYLRKDRQKRQIRIIFSSQSFSMDDNEYLCDLVNSKYDLGFTINKCNTGTGYLISVKQSYVDKFYSIIEKCPVQEMSYKWK